MATSVKGWRAALAGAIALAASGVGGAAAQEPRIGVWGSTTVGDVLMPALIEAYAKSANLAVAREPGPTSRSETLRVTLDGAAVFTIALERPGSGASFPALLSGQAEIGMASRPVKDAEAEALKLGAGIDLRAPDSEHILALDGLAIVVHPQNPLSTLDLDTIAKVFSGEIADWRQLGRAPGPITVHARDDVSGTFDTFNALVLKRFKKDLVASAQRHDTNISLAAAVAADPNAIGFVPFAFLEGVKPMSIALACGIVVGPSKFAVKAEEYPLGRRLFLYTKGRPPSSAADLLLKYALSDAAQPVIDQVGFVDQSLIAQNRRDYSDHLIGAMQLVRGEDERAALMRFGEATRTAVRLSTTFRFRSGGVRLDGKAIADAGRLARWMEAEANAGATVTLIGYSDAVGGYQGNVRLSRQRAEAIRRAVLVQVRPGFDADRIRVMGLSTVAPVACNDDPAGRAVNRRVEVWAQR